MTDLSPVSAEVSISSERSYRRLSFAAVLWIAGAVVLLWIMAWQGVRFRSWTWDLISPIRSNTDIDRCFNWGRLAAHEGVVNQYEKMQPQLVREQNTLDLAPLHLAVLRDWAHWAEQQNPKLKSWKGDPTAAAALPIIRINYILDIIGAISAFWLVWVWARRFAARSQQPPLTLLETIDQKWFETKVATGYPLQPLPWHVGLLPAALAMALYWFNPAIVLGEANLSGDVWVMPFFLLAAVLATLDRWLAAGLVIGIGLMLKGQQVVSLPVFLLWGLFNRRPVVSARCAAGVLIAVALVTIPWTLSVIPTDQLAVARYKQSPHQAWQVPEGVFALTRVVDRPAVIWVMLVMIVPILVPLALRYGLPLKPAQSSPMEQPRWRQWINSPSAFLYAICVALALMTLIWPWLLKRNHGGLTWGFILAIGYAAAVVAARGWRQSVLLAATSAAAASLLCMWLFHGSTSWFDCGFKFGMNHYPVMAVGMTDNLPAVLARRTHWPFEQLTSIVTTISFHPEHFRALQFDHDLTAGQLMSGVFVIALLLAAFGAGMQARRGDSRLLVALVAGWLLFFSFAPQVSPRYLIYTAGAGCICTGCGAGTALLAVLVSLAAVLMNLHEMMSTVSRSSVEAFGLLLSRQWPALLDPDAGVKLTRVASGMHPDLGFAITLIALIYLYTAVAPRKSRGWA